MKQTLSQAIFLARTGKDKALARASFYLEGCPVGGWAQTDQAWRQIEEDLPKAKDRLYTTAAFVAAVYDVDFADRYKRKI